MDGTQKLAATIFLIVAMVAVCAIFAIGYSVSPANLSSLTPRYLVNAPGSTFPSHPIRAIYGLDPRTTVIQQDGSSWQYTPGNMTWQRVGSK